jgi:PAS domain S-box-containing protein
VFGHADYDASSAHDYRYSFSIFFAQIMIFTESNLIVTLMLLLVLALGAIIVFYLHSKGVEAHLAQLIEKEQEDSTRIQAIIDTAYDALVRIDSEGTIIGWSHQAERVFGWSASQIVGNTLDNTIIPERYRDAHIKGLEKFVETGTGPVVNKIIEISSLNINGDEFPIELTIAPVKVKKGIEFNAFIRDISQRKKAEEELQTSYAQLQTAEHEANKNLERLTVMLERAVDAIVTIGMQSQILSFNKAAEKIFGYQASEIIGCNINLLMPEPFRSEHDAYVRRFIETKQSDVLGNMREVLAQKKDGTVFPITAAVSAFLWEDEYIFTGIIRDITQEKEMENSLILAKEQAEKASKAKSEFLSSMSHELRTPLNAILGFSELLRTNTINPLAGEQLEEVNLIHSSGKHLLVLINEVLELSAIENRRVKLVIEPIKISDVIEDSLSLISSIENKTASVINVVSAEDLYVHADYTKLKQILVNFISNAIKYNRDHGTITISWEETKHHQGKINVEDTGIGIAKNQQDAVFDAFNRLGHENSVIEGTGIGLLVTKELVELMDGNINFESKEGEGSNFWVELPLSEK